jgi:hypothetical protein
MQDDSPSADAPFGAPDQPAATRKKTKQEIQRERLAEQLRMNLRRRKAQIRARASLSAGQNEADEAERG